jgi:hypothetical protein
VHDPKALISWLGTFSHLDYIHHAGMHAEGRSRGRADINKVQTTNTILTL